MMNQNHHVPEISNLHYGKYAIVSEFGLYQLILRSDKPEARAFRYWITHTVIPAIRKTGSYSFPENMSIRDQPEVSLRGRYPPQLILSLEELKKADAEVKMLTAENEQLEEKNQVLQSKANLLANFVASEASLIVRSG